MHDLNIITNTQLAVYHWMCCHCFSFTPVCSFIMY